jgi:predicted enzyme related to lactoylglutathione lyase
MLAQIAGAGVTEVTVLPDEGNGRFAHLLDPDGRKIELWEPKPYG